MSDIGQDIETAVNSVAGRVMTAYQANANQARTTFGRLTLAADINCMRLALIAEIGPGAMAMLEERARQVNVEGFDDKRDDAYPPGILAAAGLAYGAFAMSSPSLRNASRLWTQDGLPPNAWPWSLDWWKPGRDDSNTSRLREYAKCGALVIAEMDRLHRENAHG